MSYTSDTIIVILLIVLGFTLLLVGLIYLQIRLAKSSKTWVGYILSALFFLSSITYLINRNTSLTGMVEDMNGKMVEVTYQAPSILTNILEFTVANIPTIILVLITLYIRDQNRRERELKNMKVKDL